jgi:hypothetical protein
LFYHGQPSGDFDAEMTPETSKGIIGNSGERQTDPSKAS